MTHTVYRVYLLDPEDDISDYYDFHSEREAHAFAAAQRYRTQVVKHFRSVS